MEIFGCDLFPVYTFSICSITIYNYQNESKVLMYSNNLNSAVWTDPYFDVV